MTAIAQMPVGKIIASINAESVSDLSEPIEAKMSKILDIITYRLPIRGVETTYQNLLEELFSLRFDVLSQISAEQLLNLSPTKATNTTDYIKNFKGLTEHILPIYLHISKKLLQMHNPKKKLERISLKGFYTATSFLSEREAKAANDFIDDSLRIEFALIASDCFQLDSKSLPPSVSKDLYNFLKQSFERYAARAAFLKIWQPDTYQPQSQMITNILIVQSMMQADAGMFSFETNKLKDIQTHFEQTN